MAEHTTTRDTAVSAPRRRSRGRAIEVMDFVIILCGVFVVWVLLMYGKAMYLSVNDRFSTHTALGYQRTFSSYTDQAIPEISQAAQKLDSYVGQLSDADARNRARIQGTLHSYHLEEYVKHALTPASFKFSILPPGKWLIVPSIGVHAPIVDIAYASPEKIEKWDFYTELEQGVVKYPYTAEPGTMWNSVIFGHSSTEFRDKNKYWYIFQKLSKLNDKDQIQILWDGKIFDYEVQKKMIKRPKDVAAELNQYKEWEFLTLMACYPLLSDAQRMLVVAQRKNTVWAKLTKL